MKTNNISLLLVLFITGCISTFKKGENTVVPTLPVINIYTPPPTVKATATLFQNIVVKTNTPTPFFESSEMNNEEYFQKIDSALVSLNGKIADIRNDLSLVKNMKNEISAIRNMVNNFENKVVASSTIEISSLETQLVGMKNKIDSFIKFGEQNFSDLRAENVHGNQISNIYNSNGFIIGGFSIITILLLSLLLFLSIKNKKLERKVDIINRDLNNKVKMIEERKINC